MSQIDLGEYILERKGLMEDRALFDAVVEIAQGHPVPPDPKPVRRILKQRAEEKAAELRAQAQASIEAAAEAAGLAPAPTAQPPDEPPINPAQPELGAATHIPSGTVHDPPAEDPPE
jgi:hypothetical protein